MDSATGPDLVLIRLVAAVLKAGVPENTLNQRECPTNSTTMPSLDEKKLPHQHGRNHLFAKYLLACDAALTRGYSGLVKRLPT
jgi:hypothetical protein